MKRALALVVFVAFGVTCSAQEITVRVFNAKNGQPLPNETVKVQFMGSETSSSPVRLATDIKGEAHFNIPNHTEHIDVRVVLKSGHWDCGCWVTADTKQVQQGVLAYTPVRGREAPAAKPNEIVVMARPLSFIENLLWPLVKQ
jgi:hypothetical protein